MRILFLYPPQTDAVKSYLSHLENEEGIGFKPPLGILYVATRIMKTTGHEVKVVDCHVHQYTYDQVIDIVDQYRPDVVGITAWTDFWYSASRLASTIKAKFPEIFIVIGGPHVLCFPRETLEYPGVDAVVAGDGEVPMTRILECLESGQMENNIPGVHFRQFGVHDNTFYYEKDLDTMPIPDRTLLPVSLYSSVLGSGRLISTMITSRGCPYSCVFCKIHSQRPVSHSAERVLDEFDRIHSLGIREVEIYDDTFTWSHKRVVEICRGLIARNYNIKWAIRDRVSNVNEETLIWMKKAGCTRIHYGIESGSNEVLKRVKKRITVEEAEAAVKLARRVGFQVLTFFMIGLPGETTREINQTIDFSRKLDSDYCQYSITIPYPGTEMYLLGLESGVYPTDFWREFVRKPVPDFVIPFSHFSEITIEEMIRLRNKAIFKYYCRPKTILGEIRHLSSIRELRRKSEMAVSLMKSVLCR
ncbi:MAG: radical SAM protein [Thermodesulfobacteriota bacterium]|nr:radical SAM protein [Thermodesulfobacteriota bacterium]